MAAFVINYFFLFATAAVYFPYFQLFLKARGFSPSQLGVLMAFARLAGIIGPLLLGRLADRSGRFRRILAVCMPAFALALIPLNSTSSFFLSVPLVIVAGFSYHSIVPLTDALANRTMKEVEKNWGRARLFGTISFIIVSLLYRFAHLIDGESSSSILVNQLVLCILYAGTLFVLPRKAGSGDRSPRQDEGGGLGKTFWLGIGIIFLAALSASSHLSFLSLYLHEMLGISNVSGMWALCAVIELPVFFFAGPLIRRFGLRRMFLVSFFAIVVRLLLYALFPVRPAIIAAQLLHGITFALFYASAVRYVSRIAGFKRIGVGMTIFSALGNGLAVFIGSLAGGYIIEALGFQMFYAIYTLPALAAIVILITAGKRIGIP